MCLIAVAWKVHPRYPLILAGNRDEFHARPTRPLAPWPEATRVLGGRDLQAGGGWLAVDPARRRLAAVTNVREPADPAAVARRSRGDLVRDYLLGDRPADQAAADLLADGPAYGPFNLLLLDGERLVYVGNRPAPQQHELAAGVYGVSNGAFDAPWPKSLRLTAVLREWLAALPPGGEPVLEPLFAALADEQAAAPAELPQTGVGAELERRLSPAFIRGPVYGTRASSVVLMDVDGGVRFVERSFGADGVAGALTRCGA